MLSEIVDWAEQKTHFWQLAIEKLVRNNQLSTADIEEIKDVCKIQNGLSNATYVPVDFTALRQFILASTTESSLVITKLHGLQNINALSSSAILEFSPNGLTLIYGDNGSGKSSYTAILKHVCTTRGHRPPINANLFNAPGTILDKLAQFDHTDDHGATSLSTSFKNGSVSDDKLKKINVFDSHSAQHYIAAEDEIAFIPYGLALIEKFAAGLKTIETDIDDEINELEKKRFDVSQLLLEEGTLAKQFIDKLSGTTTRSELWSAANWDTSNDGRIVLLEKEIGTLRATDPQKNIVTNNGKLGRFKIFKSRLEQMETQLSSDEEIQGTEEIVKTYKIAAETLQLSSGAAFSGLPLPNVGGESWKKLWESARVFYNEIRKDEVFPETENDSHCPLCLQNLDDQAKARMSSFEDFIKQDSQKNFDEALKNLNERIVSIEKINLNIDSFEPTVTELEATLSNLGTIKEDFEKYLRDIQLFHLEKLQKKGSSDAAKPDKPAESPIVLIDGVITSLEKENADLQTKSIADELKLLENELKELRNRKRLHLSYPRIGKEIYRLRKKNKLNTCKSQCNTRTLTALSNHLTSVHVTDSLQQKFQLELKCLGFKNIKIDTGTKGVRGKQYHYLRLNEANPQGIPLKDILSEGEHRCIALATFLSELSLSSHSSGVIFDDPVSSLDHRWRNKIAERIAEESRMRQVIVFTHDITFLLMIQEHCQQKQLDLQVKSLTRKPQETGIVTTNPPWDTQAVKARIGLLKLAHVELARIEKNETEDEYKAKLPPLYGKLRETWERAIEEVVLHDVIKRFGREVQTKRLAKVIDLTQADYDAVDTNMSKCSKFFVGHDNSGALNEQLPDAAEFLSDIIVLENLVNTVRARRK